MEPHTHTYKSVPGCDIKVDVYPAVGRGPLPAIVFIHGGCLMYGSRQEVDPRQLELYVEAGFTTLSIDYRLAPETGLPDIIEDLRDALRWAHSMAPTLAAIDPDRVAIVGQSAGGYMALMAGFCATPRPRALVSFYGYGDIVGDWYVRPDPYYCQAPRVSPEDAYRFIAPGPITESRGERASSRIYLYCRQHGLWPKVVGRHDPHAEPEFFKPYCPVRNVTRDYPPTLLMHGDRDTDVPCAQSVLMAEQLTRTGVEHRLITLRGYGHGFDGDLTDPQVAAALQAVLAFLKKHTSPHH